MSQMNDNTNPQASPVAENAPHENPTDKKEKKKKTVAQEILSWVLTLGGAVVLALIIRTLLFEPIRVDGQSMQNTLMDGDIVVATKPEYLLGHLNRGDIVICHYPNRGSTMFIKRLIALPGDTVMMINGVVYVNGEMVDESGIDSDIPSHFTMTERTLGENEYWVMGDNRGNSNDSRSVGPLTRDMILGHVQLRLFPFSRFGSVQ